MYHVNNAIVDKYESLSNVLAAMSLFIIGMWISWPSSSVKKILAGQTKLIMDADRVSWAVALLDFGNVLSPIPSSYISNWLGRKRTLMVLSVALLSTWLLVVFGNNEYYLYAARVLVGLSKGFAFTVVPIYLGEIASTSVRGSVGTIFCAMMNSGILFELCLGPLFTYDTLNIISSPFPILFFLCFVGFPESPYFLLMKGRVNEARKSLAWFRDCGDDSPVLNQELEQISRNFTDEATKIKGSYKGLVQTSSARKALVISMGFALLQRLAGCTSIISYSAVTLPVTGGYFTAEVYMIIFGVTMIVGAPICGALVDKVGRKPLIIASSMGCGIFTGITALFYWLANYSDLSDFNWVPYFCLIAYGMIFSIGLGTLPSVIVVELFPSELRSYATSLSAICYASGSFITNKLYLFVKTNFGVHYIYLFFTVNLIICVILACTMFFETSGKTFLEIQQILKKEEVEHSISQNDKSLDNI